MSKNRQTVVPVPMITTPIIPEPYQRMAWDLVGKMPRTKTGFSYILTVMCLGSRFPYAIPLQWVDAESVAEGLSATPAYLLSFCQTRGWYILVR